MSTLVGQRLGNKYDIQAEIGRGGMGVVYRGFDIMLQRPVAVKVLPQEFTYDSLFVQRFRQEAVMAAGLHHKGIVTIHDVGEQNAIHYIVMQYLEGSTLEQWLAQHGRLSLPQANHVVRQVAEALDYAHQRGIVHRDVKPSNIMLAPSGQVTLMDFGLVRAGEGTGLTRSGTVVGTPEYMAPEQALGQTVDGRSDIYAFGVVLYKMLSGQVPFSRSTAMATAYAHVHEAPPLLRTVLEDLPAAVEAVVFKALAKQPAERYAQAGQMADDFHVAISGNMPAGLQRVTTPLPLTSKPRSSNAAPQVRTPFRQRTPSPQPPVAAQEPTQWVGGRSATPQPAPPTARPAPQRRLPLTILALAALFFVVAAASAVWIASNRLGSSGGGDGKTPLVETVPAIFLPSPTATEHGLAPVATATPTEATLAPTATKTATSKPEATGASSATPTPTASTTATATSTPTRATTTPSPTSTSTRASTPSPTSTGTRAAATDTPRPTNTLAPSTNTPVPPTATPRPTNTPVPPTNTPRPTNTPVPPTNTPVPPTNTPVPEPTNTPVPPTNTPVPEPTNTPVP